jgi:hypothetical protein
MPETEQNTLQAGATHYRAVSRSPSHTIPNSVTKSSVKLSSKLIVTVGRYDQAQKTRALRDRKEQQTDVSGTTVT